MSEEEIIDILENTIKTGLAGQWDYFAIEIAIKGLLDLYNKEKIRNSIITNWFGTAPTYEDGKYLNYISKDKIRAKIEELKEKEQELTDEQGYWGGSELQAKIEVLEELLEE